MSLLQYIKLKYDTFIDPFLWQCKYVWHPESPGMRVWVIRNPIQRMMYPKEFATLTEALKIPENVYEAPLPDWAIAFAYGAFIPGAQLCTRDGRKSGNAVLIHIQEIDSEFYSVPVEDLNLYICLTDMGNELRYTLKEMQHQYYPPEYVMDLMEATLKRAVK